MYHYGYQKISRNDGTPCKYEARENLILGLAVLAFGVTVSFFPKKYYF